MTVFESVKSAVTPRMAAERYGLQVNRSGMTRCPFHSDRTPSMKLNEDYFYCFGCTSRGDVIDLTAKLFSLSAQEAAKKLASDFGITDSKPSVLTRLQRGQTQVENENLCFRVLRDYLKILEDWQVRYAPKSPADEPDPRFTEACHMLECTKYMLNILTVSNVKERAELVADMMKGNKITLMKERVREIKGKENGRN